MARCCADNNETMVASFPDEAPPPHAVRTTADERRDAVDDICTIRIHARVSRQTPCFIASLEAAKVRLSEMELGYIL